jgi:hypothetical protein
MLRHISNVINYHHVHIKLTPQEEQPHLVVQPEALQQLEQEQEGIFDSRKKVEVLIRMIIADVSEE